jgi:hypothetical protein
MKPFFLRLMLIFLYWITIKTQEQRRERQDIKYFGMPSEEELQLEQKKEKKKKKQGNKKVDNSKDIHGPISNDIQSNDYIDALSAEANFGYKCPVSSKILSYAISSFWKNNLADAYICSHEILQTNRKEGEVKCIK